MIPSHDKSNNDNGNKSKNSNSKNPKASFDKNSDGHNKSVAIPKQQAQSFKVNTTKTK